MDDNIVMRKQNNNDKAVQEVADDGIIMEQGMYSHPEESSSLEGQQQQQEHEEMKSSEPSLDLVVVPQDQSPGIICPTSPSSDSSVIRNPKRSSMKPVRHATFSEGLEDENTSMTSHNSSESDEEDDHDHCLSCRKLSVLLVLIIVASLGVYSIYRFSSQEEIAVYHLRFDDAASQIVDVMKVNARDTLEFYNSWSLHMTAAQEKGNIANNGNDGSNWPFVTHPNFETLGQDARDKTGARLVALAPLVRDTQRQAWEEYASGPAQGWVQDTLQRMSNEDNNIMFDDEASISERIYHHGTTPSSPRSAPGPLWDDLYLPIWQPSPIAEFADMINFDMFNLSLVPKVYETMIKTNQAVMSETIFHAVFPENNETSEQQEQQQQQQHPPESFVSVPIYDQLYSNQTTAAALVAMVPWEHFLENVLPEGIPPLVVVIENPCAESFTYELQGKDFQYIGLGDHHDPLREDLEVSSDIFDDSFAQVPGCGSTVHIYPTHAFEDVHITSQPMKYALLAVGLFLVTVLAFLAYDHIVERKQRKLKRSVKMSDTLLDSLFPQSIRKRMIKDLGDNKQQKKNNKQHDHGGQDFDAHASARSEIRSDDFCSSKPIAQLFPNATVLFADIAGFTAWASSREPAQVFTLLETIYNAFDKIAHKTNVFKVETIGDCYVAAAGLPEERDDHAVVMARFALACIAKMAQVVRQLEVTLGPDTADLGMRAGLHSGPVTAGVLRGEKSRFQLFGDTVNVASKMEAMANTNAVHISQRTADLILNGSDDIIVSPCRTLLDIKGHGKMQTYYLKHEEKPKRRPTKPRLLKGSSFAFPGMDGETISGLFRTSSVPALPTMDKQTRLIDWNVDVLQSLLKKIVAMRAPDSIRSIKKIAKMSIKRVPDNSVIDEVREIIYIPTTSTEYARDPDSIQLSSVVLAQLRDFVTVIAMKYRKNPFHSFEHASHVTQSVIKLMSRIVEPEAFDYNELTYKKKASAALHEYTYGITSDPLTQFAAAFAAMIHDLDHPGVPNAQLVKEETDVAQKYKNKSVAEQNSVDMAWEILMREEYLDLRGCIYNSRRELYRFRQLVINSVMATDIVDKDLKTLRNERWSRAFDAANDHPTSLESAAEDMNRKATIVIEHLIQASDISHTMQHWRIYIKWNERFFHECYQAYLDGRAETDPADGWYKGELGFFDFYIIPLAKKLKECGVFGVSSDEFLDYALSNRAEWEQKGEDLVEKYIASYKESVFGGFKDDSNHNLE